MRIGWAAVPALFLALVAGCGSSQGDAPRADTQDSPSSASSVAPSDAPSSADSASADSSSADSSSVASSSVEASPTTESASPPPNTGPVHQLGDRVRLATGSLMTVVSWLRARRPGPPAAGAWWEAEVRFCLTRTFGEHFEEPIGNIRSQLRAELTDGRPLTPEADARSPDEAFAQPVPISAGQCVRGMVVFDVPTGQEAEYLAATLSPFGWVRWQLS